MAGAAGGCSKPTRATATDAPAQSDVLVQAPGSASFAARVDGPWDTLIAELTVRPGASTGGWHRHDGPVIAAVARGTATVYDGDDPTCAAHVMQAGQALLEPAHHVHIVRNEGRVPLQLYVTFILPRGSAPGTPVPPPGNCPF